ncbi:MAG: eCIS core domain-containing protein [Pseudonocardiaceae bacterium]
MNCSPVGKAAAPAAAEAKPVLTIQRACACAVHAHAAGSCMSCTERSGVIQRCPAGGDLGCACGVDDVVRMPGQPLDAGVRVEMEGKFNADFSQVRIHTDAAAATSARNVGARAYTVGTNIAFAAGNYAPESPNGRRLLAHELTHVVQQSAAVTTSGSMIVPVGASSEGYAERAAGEVAAGRPVSTTGPATGAAVARQAAAQVRDDVRAKIERINSLLSYGFFDWAITDREAVEALMLLRSMSQQDRAIALRQINVDRLLDNLPERRKPELAVFLVSALPPSQIGAIIGRSLETSLIDWFVTANDASGALDLIETLPPDQRDRVFDGLGPAGRRRLWEALPAPRRADADRLWAEKQQRIYEQQSAAIHRGERPAVAAPTGGQAAVEQKRQEFMRWLSPGSHEVVTENFDITAAYIRWVEQHTGDPEFLRIKPWELYERVAAQVRERVRELRADELDVLRRQGEIRERSRRELEVWDQYQAFIRERSRRIGELGG